MQLLIAIALLAAALTAQDPPVTTGKPVVTIAKKAGHYRVEIDGQHFTSYLFEGWPNPILYPVYGAHGAAMTRNHPMAQGADEARDHKHHRSLWFTHGAINGHDFWSGAKMTVVQEHAESGQRDGAAFLTTRNSWLADGQLIVRDERTLTFHASTAGRFIDYSITFVASAGDVVFGDTKEGTMAIRVAPTLRLKGKVAAGRIRNSEGVRDKQVWGKRARWVDYYGPVAGKTVGVAIFDHPSNHGHPCHWHARDYGLFAANPFGRHHFGGGKKGSGDFKLAKGQRLQLRYRFFFHAGDTAQARVANEYGRFIADPQPAPRRDRRRTPTDPGKRDGDSPGDGH